MPARPLAAVRHHAMVLADHEFEVPLDHDRPSGEKLSLFARAVRSVKKSAADLPWLVFLQGGPGFPGPRPLANTGWLKRALDDYQVLLLDSRGNGRSSVVLPQTLARRGDARAQADYLMHFRADSIVRDAEWIRRQLVGDDGEVERARPELRRVLRGPLPVRASRRVCARSSSPAGCRRSRRAPTTTIGRPIPRSRARRAGSSIATRRTSRGAIASSSTCTGTR